MEIDYIIVGAGLAGMCFAEHALQHNKKIIVFDNKSQNSTAIAGGLYNPVILKRFSEVWEAKKQMAYLAVFYAEIEKKVNSKIDYKIPILRKFFSVEEQNNWFVASDKANLSPYLSTTIHKKKYVGIESPHNFGEVLHAGYVDTALLQNKYWELLKTNERLYTEEFRYDLVKVSKQHVEYKGLIAKNIVFAEGFGMHSNPYFNTLPLDGTKGELFIIKAEKLVIDCIVNTSIFIIPLGNSLYKVGATYNWKDKTNAPTTEAKYELVARLQEILNCDFEIVKHFAGIRPTVRDRKPLIGTHKTFKNIHLLNGLGTRGVMLAPIMSLSLFNYIEKGENLDALVDIQRYYKKGL